MCLTWEITGTSHLLLPGNHCQVTVPSYQQVCRQQAFFSPQKNTQVKGRRTQGDLFGSQILRGE